MIETNWREYGHEVWFCLSASNPNARLFKTYWRLFTRHSAWEGDEFLVKASNLCTYEAQRSIEWLGYDGEPVWLYPFRRPRWDPEHMPWQLRSARWRCVQEWAPAYDNDPDPVTQDGFR